MCELLCHLYDIWKWAEQKAVVIRNLLSTPTSVTTLLVAQKADSTSRFSMAEIWMHKNSCQLIQG